MARPSIRDWLAVSDSIAHSGLAMSESSTRVSELKTSRMVRPARLERATSWFVARRSIQLSYGRDRLSILTRTEGGSKDPLKTEGGSTDPPLRTLISLRRHRDASQAVA